MRAVLLTGHGGPEKLEYRKDVPIPKPDRGEVLIEVGAAGINNTDIWTREGAYGTEDDPDKVQGWRREPLKFPRIQGADIAGRIIAVGNGVSEAGSTRGTRSWIPLEGHDNLPSGGRHVEDRAPAHGHGNHAPAA